FLLLNWWVGPRKWAFTWAAGIAGVSFLPWLLYVLPIYQTRGVEANLNWAHRNLFSAVPALFFNFLGGWQFGSYRLSVLAIAASAVIHLGLLMLFWLYRDRFWPLRASARMIQRWFWPAVVLTAIPVVVLLGFSVVVARAFEARFILGAVIPYSIALFLLCVACGRAGQFALLCILLPWKLVDVGASIYGEMQPDAARQSLEFAAERARPGDVVLVENPNRVGVVYWEWVRRLHRTERIVTVPAPPSDPLRMRVLEPVPVERLPLDGVERMWVFLDAPPPPPALAGDLAARGFFPTEVTSNERVRSFRGIPGVVVLFERKSGILP
ncbi:MAG TPA: hypothetical protein VGQ11_00855, partial [Candidatus Acidoferrales bacterium]|nr:hypothetical protein [Candidatus Acidoferrales bacterium]